MLLRVVFIGESFATRRATQRYLACMGEDVSLQAKAIGESFPAGRTLERSIVRVCTQMAR